MPNAPPARDHADPATFFVVEPEAGRLAPESSRIVAGDGRVLTRRRHGYAARLQVEDLSGGSLPVATLLRAAAAAGRALEALGDTRRPLTIRLGPAGTENQLTRVEGLEILRLDGAALAEMDTRHPAEALLSRLLGDPSGEHHPPLPPPVLQGGQPRVLFFESLMASELPHNESEISQGVLHMISALEKTHAEVVLADVKMPLGGRDRPLHGLDRLAGLLSQASVHLVCVTLLEDYFAGVQHLLDSLRELGCRAHVAVGGVMPSLTPEHVAAHLREVTFVCRGAGEYFVPRLAEIVGTTDADTPLSEDQCRALMALDGLLTVDRAGRRLIAGNPGRVVQVEDLDTVDLDLSRLQAHHIEGGIEISTARGCTHGCRFCSIIGRGRYQARSAGAILRLLDGYQARFGELFGPRIPENAYRVHISDDDFGCEPERAAAFLQQLLQTPFRLSSVQLSIADLCRRENGRLIPEVDPVFLAALQPECFADSRRDIPPADRVADYRLRSWSSYLQLGIESFSDRELKRLGKGYSVEHIRAVIRELSARQLHVDGYFILSNGETDGDDLLDSLEELCRLKLRHSTCFHLRYPAVQHLVSYFPSASHRRHVRRGTFKTLALRRIAAVANHPEFDYPFVEHDVPVDPWVRHGVEGEFLTDGARYTDSLVQLRHHWMERVRSLPHGSEKSAGEQLIRRLDDAPRRLVFEMMSEVRRRRRESSGTPDSGDDEVAWSSATAVLGPRERWIDAFRRFEHRESPRLVVIPTWQCQLRCRYCYVPKQDGRVMDRRTLERSVDLLLGSHRPKVTLQFFGAEPLVEYGLVQHGIEYGAGRAPERGKELSFILSTNGWALDEAKLRWLAGYPIKLELSLDGDSATQNRFRRAAEPEGDTYLGGIVSRAEAIVQSGLPHEVIMVVHPSTVERMVDNFFHIASLGFHRVQINIGLGMAWPESQMKLFASGLFEIGNALRQRWAAGESLTLVNLEHRPLPMRLNGEITVDFDGTIYGGNGFLHENEHKQKFVLGHLDDLTGFDRHWLDMPTNDFLLRWTYPPEITTNNLKVGRIYSSFLKWMQGEDVSPPSLTRH